jgi:hypothetical protein
MTQPVDWNGKGPSGDPSHPPPEELGMGPINNQLTVLGEFGTLFDPQPLLRVNMTQAVGSFLS